MNGLCAHFFLSHEYPSYLLSFSLDLVLNTESLGSTVVSGYSREQYLQSVCQQMAAGGILLLCNHLATVRTLRLPPLSPSITRTWSQMPRVNTAVYYPHCAKRLWIRYKSQAHYRLFTLARLCKGMPPMHTCIQASARACKCRAHTSTCTCT